MIGNVIGNYRILKKLGEGGMGTVYLARDMSLEREVALKIISPELARNPRLMARFRVEAIAQAKLNHHNITSIHSFDQEKNNYYIVMEHVNGKTLKAIIKEKGQIPLAEALNIFSQILTGIAYAHSQGVIHRDIKPSNIFLDEHHTVKIGDFGIAKVKGIEGLTKMGASMGSPLYSSPEQLMGKKINAGTDVYSLGITLYEMLTGKLPFKPSDDSDYKIIKEAIEAEPLKPSKLDSSIPAAVDEMILKSLAKSPADRFGSVEEFKQAVIQSMPRATAYQAAYAVPGKKEPTAKKVPKSTPEKAAQKKPPKKAPPKKTPKKAGEKVKPAPVKIAAAPGDPARRKQIMAVTLALSAVLIGIILFLLFTTESDHVPQTPTSTTSSGQVTQPSAGEPAREFPTTVTPTTPTTPTTPASTVSHGATTQPGSGKPASSIPSGLEKPASGTPPVTKQPTSYKAKPSSSSAAVSPAVVPGQMDRLIKNGQYASAVALGLKTIKKGPVIADIYFKLAQAYYYDGKKKQARPYYWKTLKLTDAIRFKVYYQFKKAEQIDGTLAISKSKVSFQPHRGDSAGLRFSIQLSRIKKVSVARISDIKGIFKKKKNRKNPMLVINGKQKKKYAIRTRTQDTKERGFIKDIIDTLRKRR
jgi:serine/threonine-protein kinase